MIVFGGEGICDRCEQLAQQEALLEIMERAWDDALHLTRINDSYLTRHQDRLRKQHLSLQSDKFRVALIGRDCRLANLMRALEDEKKIVLLIASNKIPRVHAVLAQAEKRGLGVSGTIDLLKKAAGEPPSPPASIQPSPHLAPTTSPLPP